jgi:hypothetical protein
MVNYGTLMEMVNSKNRWVYKGSVTTPPCGRFVYWNVLSTIYPISRKHLNNFKQQLNLGENGNLDESGNWRRMCAEDEHAVAYIKEDIDVKDPKKASLIAGVVILGCLTFILLIITVCLLVRKPAEPEEGKP